MMLFPFKSLVMCMPMNLEYHLHFHPYLQLEAYHLCLVIIQRIPFIMLMIMYIHLMNGLYMEQFE